MTHWIDFTIFYNGSADLYLKNHYSSKWKITDEIFGCIDCGLSRVSRLGVEKTFGQFRLELTQPSESCGGLVNTQIARVGPRNVYF